MHQKLQPTINAMPTRPPKVRRRYPTNSGRTVHDRACVRMGTFCASACERLIGKLTICGPRTVSERQIVGEMPFHFERPPRRGREILMVMVLRWDETRGRKVRNWRNFDIPVGLCGKAVGGDQPEIFPSVLCSIRHRHITLLCRFVAGSATASGLFSWLNQSPNAVYYSFYPYE